MATTPTICFNESPAQADDYFNHDEIYNAISMFESGKSTLNTGQTSEIKSVFISHDHDDEITDVSFYVTPYTGSTSAEVIGTNSENFNIQNGSNDLFIIKLNEETFNYEITLTSGSDQSAQDICDDINTTINELVAFVDSGKIKLISPAKGLSSKIYIIDTNNTANSVLGFIGNDTNPVSIGTTGNWGLRGNGSRGKSVGTAVTYPFTITNSDNQFNISLNFNSPIECTITPTTINNDNEFKNSIDTALINAGFKASIIDPDYLGKYIKKSRALLIGHHDFFAFCAPSNTWWAVFSNIESNKLVFTSFSTQDNTFVHITSGSNDATSKIGMQNPVETGTDYANSNETEDKNELISWGDFGYGLEIGDPLSNFTRIVTGTGDSLSNSISLTWGDGTTSNDIAKFDYSGGDSNGEIELKLKLSVPPDETETGYREWSLAVQFTYI